MSNATILTPQLFTQYCDNYFLGNSAPKNILNGHITQQLPTLIKNVETSLNSMLNGRLYNKYNPANLTFNGNNILSPTVEQETLYSLLTEAVLYKIQTGIYVNVNNNFGGNINGSNNFQTSNSNVVGLRNDIRDKLVLLGLYKNANFANAATPNVYAAASPGVNQGPLTMQSLAQLNTYITTNNFTLTGRWDFSKLSINGVNINSFVENLITKSDSRVESILTNYLPDNPIPLITSQNITTLNNTQTILKNYLPNTQIPAITPQSITEWNQAVIEVNNMINNNGSWSEILTNYLPNGVVPAIGPDDIEEWNNCATQIATITSSLLNYRSGEAIPLITQSDIDKWNAGTGSSSGGGGNNNTGTNVSCATYTVTVTNNWTINYKTEMFILNSTTAVVSPDLSTNGFTLTWTQSTSENQYINFALNNNTKTILSVFVYPGVSPTANIWTNIQTWTPQNDYYFNGQVMITNGTQNLNYEPWGCYTGALALPIYVPLNSSIYFGFTYQATWNGSGTTVPTYPNETFAEVCVFMIDVVFAG